jgi:hypothetical protein
MKSSRWLWVCVGGIFLLMACAWTTMFFFAGRAQVQSVPLVSAGRAGPPGPQRTEEIAGTQTGRAGASAIPGEKAR